MAFGYGSDQISLGMQLALATQGVLLFVLVTPLMRRLTQAWSPERLTLVAILAITGSTALYHGVFPVLGVGLTTGLITIFVTMPLTVTNSLLCAIRAFVRQPKGSRRAVVFWVPLSSLVYWVLVFAIQAT